MEQRPHLAIQGLQTQASTDQYPEATADTCQDGCRRLVSCVCCCSRVHKSTRIKIVWILLLAIAASWCAILGCLVFRPDTPIASPSDMRAVTKRVDFLFCEGVRINSGDINLEFDAYRISGSPKIDSYRRNKGSYQTSLYIEDNSYDYYSFYFLENSSFTVNQWSKQPVTFYVFKGQELFKTWQEDEGCEECYLAKRYIQPSLSRDTKLDTFSLNIQTTDDYFLVYANEFRDQTWVDIRLIVDRSIYDLSDAASICVDSTDCMVVLEDRRQLPVYQVASYGNLYEFRHSQFATKCVPRVWSYLLFHGTFVLVVGIISSIVIQKLCKNPDSARLLNIQTNERTPLLYRTVSPPAYRNVILDPPKYDDVMRYCDPPSYRDVTRNMVGTLVESRQKGPGDVESDRTIVDQ